MTETKTDPKVVRAAKPKAFLPFAVSNLSDLIPDPPVFNRRGGCCNGSQMNFSRRELTPRTMVCEVQIRTRLRVPIDKRGSPKC
jgi:hypothetical protein